MGGGQHINSVRSAGRKGLREAQLCVHPGELLSGMDLLNRIIYYCYYQNTTVFHTVCSYELG